MELVQQTKQEWQAVQEQRKRQYTTVDQSLQQLIDKVQENLREISTTDPSNLKNNIDSLYRQAENAQYVITQAQKESQAALNKYGKFLDRKYRQDLNKIELNAVDQEPLQKSYGFPQRNRENEQNSINKYLQQAIELHLLSDGRYHLARSYHEECKAENVTVISESEGPSSDIMMMQELKLIDEEMKAAAMELSQPNNWMHITEAVSGEKGAREVVSSWLSLGENHQRQFLQLHDMTAELRAGRVDQALSWVNETLKDMRIQYLAMTFQLNVLSTETKKELPLIKLSNVQLQQREQQTKANLTRLESLAFELHVIKYLLILVKDTTVNLDERKLNAINYAQANFSSFAEGNMNEINALCCLTLYVGSDNCPITYQDKWLNEEQEARRWRKAERLLRETFFAQLEMASESALWIAATVGTIALPKIVKLAQVTKVNQKAEWTQRDELPVEIALPDDSRFHSVFVCPVSKEVASDRNPPMRLVCGHVICHESLQKLSRNGAVRFKCPYCPSECSVSQTTRVYF